MLKTIMNTQSEKDALDALVGITEIFKEQGYVSMAKFFDSLFSAFSFKFGSQVTPETVDETYTGIHLNKSYEEGDLMLMIESFRNGHILHAKYALQILNDAIKLFEKLPAITVCDLKKTKTQLKGVLVVGDLHGSFRDLYYIIKKYDIPGKQYRFVFNGDFVDRGPQQSECLLTLLYAFLLHPTRVF